MKAPDTIEVQSIKWNIKFDKSLLETVKAETSYGQTFQDKALIIVNEELPEDLQAETTLHELLHVCVFMTGLGLSTKDEEKVVASISPVLFNIFRKNPDLIKYIADLGDANECKHNSRSTTKSSK